jgi:hypothetical protein
MQALCVKSRKKGSRKRTCPKVDMPKSRQVLCALLNAYACGCDSRTPNPRSVAPVATESPHSHGGRHRLRAVNRPTNGLTV